MMEDSDPESIARGKVKSELARYPSEKSIENHSNSSPNKQNSIFSLTLDEFQYKSGRSFESMNMDEFLNSVWNVEGNLLSSNSILNEANNDDNNVATSVRLPRQGSCSIPTPFCNKTVEEVWAEISRNQSPSQNPVIVSNDLSERHQTFGEITLEDFLIKVGVIQEPCTPLPAQPNLVDSFQNHCENFSSDDAYMDPGNIGPGRMMGLEFSLPNNENNVQGNGMYQVYTPSGSFGGETSNNITETVKCNGVGAGEPSTKRRTTNGSFELAVERRQRRMIKNRESAARSRARKQAYTAELEIELNQLREENAKLKLVMAEAEDKRKPKGSKGKLLTKAQRSAEKIKTMRRTSSSAW